MTKGQILVVDDEAAQREILRTILVAEGYQVELAKSAAEALEKSARKRFDLVLTDLRMPGADGLSLVRDLSREDPPTLVIIMTGFGSLDSADKAMKQGAFDYLAKPLERDDLLRIVGRAFDRLSEGDGECAVRNDVTMPGVPCRQSSELGHSRVVVGVPTIRLR